MEGEGRIFDETPAKRMKCCDCSNTTNTVTPSTLPKKDVKDLMWREARYDSSAPDSMKKRTDYISWDDYFMGIAALSSKRSKDPHHPAGCCIVDSSNRIVGIGYNGFPANCSDDELPWNSKDEHWLHTKFPYLVHAEVNAILNKCSSDVTGARLYTHFFPCNECAKVIVQSRIKEVIFVEDQDPESDSSKASRIMLQMANVSMREYIPKESELTLEFPAREAPKIEQSTKDEGKPEAKHCKLLLSEANYDPNHPRTPKRKDFLSWDDYFMAVSFLTARRSKDPNTQVGACIVDENKRIIGLGYNGFPAQCSDDDLPWSRTAENPLHRKYLYVTHAEVNAILNKGSSSVRGATLYVALFPCNECAKVIIQAGIREVVYMQDHYHDTDLCRASRIMFQMAGVSLRQYQPSIDSVTLNLTRSTTP